MTDFSFLPETQPFFLEGSEVGVLVSHGFTGTPQSMRFLGEYLHREGGFTVIGPRLRGHATRPEEMAASTTEEWIRDLEMALETLQKRCSSIFVTGLSMGGTLTLYLAGMYPGVFSGAIPINAALFLNSPALAGLAFAKDAPAVIPGVGSDIQQPGITEMAYPVIPVPALRHLYALMAVTRELITRITCPVLVFQSRADHVVPPPNGEAILSGVTSAEKRLVWLENSYHVATLDNDRELIASESVKFIRAHS